MTDDEKLDEVLSRFKVQTRKSNGALCNCPAHDDKQASLSITAGRKGVLVKCFAGCRTADILDAVGLRMQDLFYEDAVPDKSNNWRSYVENREKRKIEAEYHYRYFDGKYAFTKLRMKTAPTEKKEMIIGRLIEGRFIYKLGGKNRKDFNAVYGDLKAVKKAVEDGTTIFIPEGEKDCDTLKKHGYTAFSCGGANEWILSAVELVKGANVVILSDNDEPGKQLARRILRDVSGVAKSARVVVPMPDVPKADISDFFAEHSKEEFEKLLETSENEENAAEDGAVDLMQFLTFAKDGTPRGVHHNRVFEYIKAHNKICVYGKVIWIYDGGVYRPDVDEQKIKSKIRELIIADFIRSNTINQIHALFFMDSTLWITEFNQYPQNWVCFKNGMYNPIKNEMLSHSPDYFANNQIPWEYRPDEQTSGMQTEKFFSEVMGGDDIQTAWQIMGLCCTCDNSFQKAIILQGAGGSGKSTLLNLITALVGRENISNLSLQQIEEKFATIQLLGKLCNICGDLESTPMKSTATFKKITGGDALTDSFKGKNLVSFVPFARLIFSANTIPLNLEEKSNAFFRRLIIIKCPHVFENPDVGMDAKLRSEMPYIINKSMDALRGLYADGYIHESETSKAAVAELYEDSDTVKAFFNHHIVSCKGAGIRTTDLYDGYKDFCKDAEREYLSKNGFYRNIRDKGIAKKTVHGYEQFADIEWKSKIENPPNADNLGGNSDGFSAARDDEINIFTPWDDSGGN